MYNNYFGLKEAPFSIAPNPDYLYMTERHQEALAHLYHSIESDAGFVLLTGDVGTGKTTVCRCFLDNLPENAQVAFILNPFLSGKELLREICQELKIEDVPSKATLRESTDSIYRHLLNNHAQGKQTVLLIDEAQHLHFKVLELIRLLTNLETDSQKLLKIVLVGQPELNTTLDKPELTQLSQRITARYHIKPLSFEETQAYIDYRLRMAGYLSEKKIFPPPVVKKIYSVTQGIPRLINVICDRAMLGTYAQSRAVVDLPILNKAIVEVHGEKRFKHRPLWYWLGGSAVAVLILVSLLIVFVFYNDQQRFLAKAPEITSRESQQPSQTLEQTPGRETINTATNTSQNSNQSLPETNQKLKEDQSIAALQKYEAIQSESEITYFSLLDDAVQSLVVSFQTQQTIGRQTCESIQNTGWQCRKVTAETWENILEYNRPGVLVLNNALGEEYYLGLTGLKNNLVEVIHAKGKANMRLDELKSQWSGDFIYLWQPPEGFSDYIFFNSSEYLVNWLANAFSVIDNRPEVLAKQQFNSLLKQRVLLFQRENDLTEDGVAGIKTLLKINEQLGVAITLNPASSTNNKLLVN
jgi:general secretion pathway protein A